jgi:hypothetical protein
MTVGLMAGQWCPHGLDPDLPGDQRFEAGGSLVFDTEPLGDALEILGAPVVELDFACDKPNGMVAVCLSEILPDGAATRITYGLCNLTHRKSHEHPESLEPGKFCRIRVQLNEAGHHFEKGNRIRVALSSVYWPIAWPSPVKTTLTIKSASSTLDLPLRPPREEDADLRPFEEPECARPLDKTVEREAEYRWSIEQDMISGKFTQHQWFDEGRTTYNAHDGWTVESTHDEYLSIHPDDPNSARLDITWTEKYERGAWQVSSQTHTLLTSTATHFVLEADLIAKQGEETVYTRKWKREFERKGV